MKRFLLLVTVLAMAFALAGCGQIGSEKAIDIALADMGITRVGAARTDATLDKTMDPPSFIVKLDMNDHIVTYVINAKTGAIASKESTAK
jgi:uncharacterized membrane protein YkoI